MPNKSLYNTEDYQEIVNRINSLTPETQPEWGSMSVAQMMAHCAEAQEVSNGSRELTGTPLLVRLFFKGMIRKAVMGEKPFKRHLQTHPQYKQTSEKDFANEKGRLLTSITDFVEMDEAKAADINHPIFGTTEREERGWGMYKHLDHHLSQFGV